MVGGDALITGNIYASGEGDAGPVTYDSKSNAYLREKAVVTVEAVISMRATSMAEERHQ